MDFLIESLGYIPEIKRPSLKIACNSVNDNEREYICSLADRLDVDLHILIDQNTEQLARLYNEASLCVYAPVLEPFGLVPLESMSCGTPVVGVREGGVQESISHEVTGLLIERNPRIFGEAIQNLLSNPELISEYGRRSRAHVTENWTWNRSFLELEQYLVNCVYETT
jgi:glycosyltransferase involved in cell wall biosynthesis